MFHQINFVEIFSSFIVMFAIIDILGSIPIFMSIREKNQDIKAAQACLTALGLFLLFFFAGDALFRLFGINSASFAVAGAFVLFILAVEMVLGRDIIKNEPNSGGASIVPVTPWASRPSISRVNQKSRLTPLRVQPVSLRPPSMPPCLQPYTACRAFTWATNWRLCLQVSTS